METWVWNLLGVFVSPLEISQNTAIKQFNTFIKLTMI
jgi:hypothetical protein